MDDRRPERRAESLALLERLERESGAGGAIRVGITGAPGAGKSTLLDAVARGLRRRDRTLGIVAVDPSSQRTGGALLGDRFHVRAGSRDDGIYFRSMAARDRLGGLADATRSSVIVMGAVFDCVFVETVGVGQSESDVSQLVDTLVYLVQPGAGDVLQFMKAGILELPDVFVVNKSDLGATAERSASELSAGLGLGARGDAGWVPPVLLVSGRDGVGVDDFLDAIEAHHRHLLETGALGDRRRRGDAAYVLESLTRRYGSYGLDALGGRGGVEARARAAEGTPACRLVLRLGREIEERLGKGGGT